ncbi:sigma factor-like helix-turn-helix DNA-binding protein [Jatrophihabitans sp. YIM 134969]
MTTAEMLAALDDVERGVVRLVYFDGLTAAEAAGRLGLERPVVARALRSAYRRVARLVLDDADPEPTSVPLPPAALAG